MSRTRLIPLGSRAGIVGYAVVDAEDFERFGSLRWYLSKGYAERRGPKSEGKRKILLHRAILGLVYGDPLWGDHINGDRLDNRRSNLRVVTPAASTQNRSANRGSRSGFRGVSWHRASGKWRARGGRDGRMLWLGTFEREEHAAAAAAAWRAEHMPFAVER